MAGVRRSIPRATNPHPALMSRAGSRRTRPRKLSSDKTVRLNSVKQEDFDTVFYPVAMARRWPGSRRRRAFHQIDRMPFIAAGKPIGIVCHSTGALHQVKTTDGKFLVQGKEVTGFTNGEEEAMGLTKVVPFLVEDGDVETGRRLLEGSELGGSRGQRRLADHRTESGPRVPPRRR